MKAPVWAVNELVSDILSLPKKFFSFEMQEQISSFISSKSDKLLENFSPDQKRRFLKAFEESQKGKPWEYILGKIDFYGCELFVDSSVLIPRQETEILVDLIVRENLSDKIFWDLCTGSGAIGIAVKKKLPSLKVTISDKSEKALEVALKNCQKNDLDIEILQGDFLEPFFSRKADCVSCNPPYISEKEYLFLDSSVRDFEPKTALVADHDGFFFYEKLSLELPFYLNPGAKLFLEIGSTQGERVKNIFSNENWRLISLVKDFSGLDRVVVLEFLSC